MKGECEHDTVSSVNRTCGNNPVTACTVCGGSDDTDRIFWRYRLCSCVNMRLVLSDLSALYPIPCKENAETEPWRGQRREGTVTWKQSFSPDRMIEKFSGVHSGIRRENFDDLLSGEKD